MSKLTSIAYLITICQIVSVLKNWIKIRLFLFWSVVGNLSHSNHNSMQKSCFFCLNCPNPAYIHQHFLLFHLFCIPFRAICCRDIFMSFLFSICQNNFVNFLVPLTHFGFHCVLSIEPELIYNTLLKLYCLLFSALKTWKCFSSFVLKKYLCVMPGTFQYLYYIHFKTIISSRSTFVFWKLWSLL